MTIKLKTRYEFLVPIFAEKISSNVFAGKTLDEIASLKLWEGNKTKLLGTLFEVTGEPSKTIDDTIIEVTGDLRKTRMIGAGMTAGKIIINGDVGMHLGEMMKGGEISVKGKADSWVGSMMEGGTIEISGSAGNYVGAAYRGTNKGLMNGLIIIHGDAGKDVGSHMKGGIIKVFGNIGEFVGIHMTNGTIFVAGDCEGRPGAAMLGGKIVICGYVSNILPTFTMEDVRSKVKVGDERIDCLFYRFMGDVADQGNGKLYIAKKVNQHLKPYEKYL